MSDIRVFVTFPESNAVFAGETLQCKIIFKNISQKPGSKGSSSQLSSPTSNGYALGGNLNPRKLQIPPLHIPSTDAQRLERLGPRLPWARPASAGHKPSYSQPASTAKLPPPPSPSTTSPNGRPNHKHKRSVSIVSLSSDMGLEGGGRGNRDGGLRSPPASSSRPMGHGRSASLQIASGRQPGIMNVSAPNSANLPGRGTQVPATPIVESEVMGKFSFPARKPQAGAPAAPTPHGGVPYNGGSKVLGRPFEFPPISAAASGAVGFERNFPNPVLKIDPADKSPQSNGIAQIDLTSPLEGTDNEQEPPARVISAQSICGETPRSSGEFYSLSNSTTETLLSEYDPKGSSRITRLPHSRRHSLLSIGPKLSESLMMGYAQVTGSFVLDGSLIQTSIFEEVKRKGVMGSLSGGGVVGVESSKSDGGFLSGFGWGLGGGGLGSLLGGGGLSSIAEMKNVASTRSVPILSTPQSILFVDLRLSPGESRSYLYKFTLPKGIPPSHRGKAIKITYSLVLGTQRPGKGVVQPTVIEIPFRVFPHVNGDGSFNTHDLMSPIVLLRDEATSECLDESRAPTLSPLTAKQNGKQESSLQDFLSYVDDLLATQDPGVDASGSRSLLTPSFGPNPNRRVSVYEELPTTSRDAVEMALIGGQGHKQCSVFEIARNGHRVAAITLARPACKLGESIMAIIDFTNAEIPCYHIHASLESSETVSPSLALRSPSSIHRATRKIYAQHSESTLFATRIIFTPTAPTSATPEFSTSGVSNSWVLRFEFITSAVSSRSPSSPNGLYDELLEQTYADDRGELYEPRQGIFVESFDACIPVRIYPNGADSGTAGGIIGVHASAAASVGFVV